MNISAGIIVFRRSESGVIDETDVLLGHMGGPLWASKDDHAWSFPKGHVEGVEDLFACAQREFQEELGFSPPSGRSVLDLGEAPGSNKRLHFFALAATHEDQLGPFRPGTFTMEWPPKSGHFGESPEIDRMEWFPLDAAARKLSKAQIPFLARLRNALVEFDRQS